nr:hypothetical protein [Tanacetum cinerariifolium]
MTSITAQQTKLDLELVPIENRLDIGKCNGRIPRGLQPKEETFQVVLDALALTPCYLAFVITADVPKVYMHRIEDQEFDALLSEEETVSFLREPGHTRVINSLNDVVIDQMHQPWRTFAALINRSLSGKTTTFDKLHDDNDEVKDDDEDDDNDDDKFEGDEDRGIDSNDVQDKKDVHVHHEVTRIHISTLLSVPVSSTPSPLPTTKTTNIPPSVLNFTSVFRFNDRVIVLETDVVELKNDPLHTQVTTNQLPQILPKEVTNFAPPVIEKMMQESLNQVNLTKRSSQPQSTYVSETTLTEFELKKILIDKINSSESYLTAPEHQECYDGLVKSYNLYKGFFSSYDVYLLKRSRDDKDKDEGPSARSDPGLKKRKTSKDAEPATSLKTKDSSSRSSKGTKFEPKSSRKSVQVEESEFEVGDTDTPQGQEGNQGNDNVEPKTESASRRDWFTKSLRPQKPIDPD